jgi:catechol 2,3-dioxygenase-like lactoylglutathione lyase family enzyme
MSDVRVDSKNYQMPPAEGFTVAYFLTVADVDRSVSFYEKVFGARVTDRGVPLSGRVFIQIANAWIIVYVGGGPTDDKPTVTLTAPTNPDEVSSFINLRVADIHSCYEQWRSRGAPFLTEPKDHGFEYRCYIRDPDGYIIEVGQSK